MNLTNDLVDLLQLVQRLQTENLSLKDRLQQKNLGMLQKLQVIVGKEEINDFYKKLGKSMGHLDSVGLVQALDGYEFPVQSTSQASCGHCQIFQTQMRDLAAKNRSLQQNQDQLLMNFNRILQKVSQYITKQMNAIFKYGQYQNALQGMSAHTQIACVDFYNDFVQQTQLRLSNEATETIRANHDDYPYRLNSSYQSNTDDQNTLRLKLLDINEVLYEYGKLYENDQEVTDLDMSRLIDQKVSVECAELNQIMLHQVELSGNRSRTHSIDERLERTTTSLNSFSNPLTTTTKKQGRIGLKNKVESASRFIIGENSLQFSLPVQQQTPILGGSNTAQQGLERRSRADRVRSGQSSFSGEIYF